MNRDGILFQYSLATEGGMNSCGASPREEQDNRLCVGCYYILDHSLSGLFILKGVLSMNENQLRELFKTNEANKTMEATFYETQKSLALIAKQAKYFYDQLILQGFNEGQAMEFMMRTFSASNQQKE